MARMLRLNFHRQPGRVQGHGACGDCKPNGWKGRSLERREWQADQDDSSDEE